MATCEMTFHFLSSASCRSCVQQKCHKSADPNVQTLLCSALWMCMYITVQISLCTNTCKAKAKDKKKITRIKCIVKRNNRLF
jgi:hypothetical protein